MSTCHETCFRAMGSEVRVIVGARLLQSQPPPDEAAEQARRYVEDYARRLSRFRADSELCALNGDPARVVPASPLLRTAVQAGLWAATRSGGLVDPTLVSALERAGYSASHEGQVPAPLDRALATAPPRAPARPDPRARWREFAVDHDARVVRRPPEVGFDTGGTGKGLAADAVAHQLRGYTRYVVDCGGDIAVGGVGAQLDPVPVAVEHPLTREVVQVLALRAGGVATSGLNINVWERGDGTFAHHLLDPSTGSSAWTGVIGATALAPTVLEAETLTKVALLGGPATARLVLAPHGGLFIHDSGEVEVVGTPGQSQPGAASLREAA